MGHAYNKRNHKLIVGVAFVVRGTSPIDPSSLAFRDGKIVGYDEEGAVSVDWRTRKPLESVEGEQVFVDEGGNDVEACDIVPGLPPDTLPPDALH